MPEKKTAEKLLKSIYASNSGGSFEIPDPGLYVGRCYKAVDIGTQMVAYQGNPPKPVRQVLIWWELLLDEEGVEVRMENGEPFTVMGKYTLSTSPKGNLRKLIDSWGSKPLTPEQADNFDISKMVGKYCNITVNHTESKDGQKTFVNVASVSMTKKKPDPVNELMVWTVTDPDDEDFNDMPEWLQNKIKESQEWALPVGEEKIEDVEISEKGEINPSKADPDQDPLDEIDWN